jgi:hypothetical protein
VKSSEIENWTTINKDALYRKFCQEMIKYCTLNNHTEVNLKQKKINKVNLKVWYGVKLIEESVIVEL